MTTKSVTEQVPLLNVLAPSSVTDPKTKLASKILEDQSRFVQRKNPKSLTITIQPPQIATTSVPTMPSQPPLQPDRLHVQQIGSPVTEQRPQDTTEIRSQPSTDLLSQDELAASNATEPDSGQIPAAPRKGLVRSNAIVWLWQLDGTLKVMSP
jgi:hypothetical protein